MRQHILRKLGVAAFAALVSVSGCSSDSLGNLQNSGLLDSVTGGSLSIDEITRGLKEALSTGSNNVVSKLGKSGGFNTDPSIRVPLPSALSKARDYAAKVGLDGSFNELENKLNEAAERATPKAKSLFLGAIKEMSVSDAKGILQGPDNAATSYFQGKTEVKLADAMRPLIDQSLSEVGAVNSFNKLVKSYKRIPGAPKINADLTAHVVEKGMSGIFYYLASEEKQIRDNPAKRTSELLQKVFAGQ